jgi:hypothetical protein
MVAVTAKFSMEKTPVTQGEPAILQITFDNRSGHGVVINLGYEDEKLDITVVDPDGQVSHKPTPTLREGWGPVDAFVAAAGETSPGSVSLSDWFVFKKVGTYRIDVSLSPISSPKEPFTYRISGNHAALTLTVLPRDEGSLDSACADLLSRVEDLHSSASALTAAKALSSIKDPVAVPYIATAIKRREFASMMITALSRLKTDQAVAALVEASKSEDPETKMLARSALAGIADSDKR